MGGWVRREKKKKKKKKRGREEEKDENRRGDGCRAEEGIRGEERGVE